MDAAVAPLIIPAIGDIAKSAVNVSSEDHLMGNDDLMVSVPMVPEIDLAKKIRESTKVVRAAVSRSERSSVHIEPIRETALAPVREPHRLWQHAGLGGRIKYTNVNIFRKGVSKACTRKDGIDGVEVRDLSSDHVLAGEQGLFATRNFEQFSIVGEYCGVVVPNTQGGHYVANLEEKGYDESVGVDAEYCGNEMRFINAYQGIGPSANVKMVTAYIASYPHLVIVCMRDILAGEEFLLDYGPNYTSMFLMPKSPPRITQMIDWGELAGDDSDEES